MPKVFIRTRKNEKRISAFSSYAFLCVKKQLVLEIGRTIISEIRYTFFLIHFSKNHGSSI